ncbi:hypothetical protein Tco_0865216 [Tanacetum coccineum]
MLAPSGRGLILYQAYGKLYAMTDECAIEEEAERKIGWLFKLIFARTAIVIGYHILPYLGLSLALKLVDLRDKSETITHISIKASLRNLYEQVSALKGVEPKKVIIMDLFDEGKETPLPKLSDSNQTLEEANLQMDQRDKCCCRDVKTKSVMLEGDLFQPGGLMTGGLVNNNKPPRRARLQAIPGPGQPAPGPAPCLGKKMANVKRYGAIGGSPRRIPMSISRIIRGGLDNCTNAATKFPQQQQKYNINGKDVDGWFPLDLTIDDFMKEISSCQALSEPSLSKDTSNFKVRFDFYKIKKVDYVGNPKDTEKILQRTINMNQLHGPVIAVVECPDVDLIKTGIRALDDFPSVSVPSNARDSQHHIVNSSYKFIAS